MNRVDPFGLLDFETAMQRALFESGTTLLGAGIGAIIGGGGGAAGFAAGPAGLATVPAGAATGIAVGSGVGLGIGKFLSPVIFKEGVYEFPDQNASEKPYLGQSGQTEARLKQHEAAGRLKPGTEKVTQVQGGKTAREIAEHKRIQELTGGKPARTSDAVSNKRDPIGEKRLHLIPK